MPINAYDPTIDHNEGESIAEGILKQSNALVQEGRETWERFKGLHTSSADREKYREEVRETMMHAIFASSAADPKYQQLELAYLKDELEAHRTYGRDMFHLLNLEREGWTYEEMSTLARRMLSYLGYHADNKQLHIPRAQTSLVGGVTDLLYVSQEDKDFYDAVRPVIVSIEKAQHTSRHTKKDLLEGDAIEKVTTDLLGPGELNIAEIVSPDSQFDDILDYNASAYVKMQKTALEHISSGKSIPSYQGLYVQTLEKFLAPEDSVIADVAKDAKNQLNTTKTSYTDLQKELQGIVAKEDVHTTTKENLEGVLQEWKDILKGELERKADCDRIFAEAKKVALDITRVKKKIRNAQTAVTALPANSADPTVLAQIAALQQSILTKKDEQGDLEETLKALSKEGEDKKYITGAFKEGVDFAGGVTPSHFDIARYGTNLGAVLSTTELKTVTLSSGETLEDLLHSAVGLSVPLKKFQEIITKVEKEITTLSTQSTKDTHKKKRAEALLKRLEDKGKLSEEQEQKKVEFGDTIKAYRLAMNNRMRKYTSLTLSTEEMNGMVMDFDNEWDLLERAEGLMKDLGVPRDEFYEELNNSEMHKEAMGLYEFVRITMELARTSTEPLGPDDTKIKQYRAHLDGRIHWLHQNSDKIEAVFSDILPRTKEHAKAKMWFRHTISSAGCELQEQLGESLSDADLNWMGGTHFEIAEHERGLMYGSAELYASRGRPTGLLGRLADQRGALRKGMAAFIASGAMENFGKGLGSLSASAAHLTTKGLMAIVGKGVMELGGKYILQKPTGALANMIRDQKMWPLYPLWAIARTVQGVGYGLSYAGQKAATYQSTYMTKEQREKWKKGVGGAGEFVAKHAPKLVAPVTIAANYGLERYDFRSKYGTSLSKIHQPLAMAFHTSVGNSAFKKRMMEDKKEEGEFLATMLSKVNEERKAAGKQGLRSKRHARVKRDSTSKQKEEKPVETPEVSAAA